MMAKKLSVIALALVGLGFGFVPGTNAGTEVIRDYGVQEPAYNYAPPRPVYYAPPPPVNVVIFPAYGYYGPRYGYHRFYGRHVYARPHHYWR